MLWMITLAGEDTTTLMTFRVSVRTQPWRVHGIRVPHSKSGSMAVLYGDGGRLTPLSGYPRPAQIIYGSFGRLVVSTDFWLTAVLTVVLALLPDVAVLSLAGAGHLVRGASGMLGFSCIVVSKTETPDLVVNLV